ncbi:MAG: MFS transporter [Oscillospiraceae bacterium]|nr:MFS transporter [Oscillospiraceae bacterium]
MEKKLFLSRGLFEKDFMNSRTDPEVVNRKERVLGHLIGPLGLIFVVNTIAALVEKFFTQQTGALYGVANVDMIMKMGGRYEVVMTTAKILAIGAGIFNGWLLQHTKSRQGRMRPWNLVFGFLSITVGCLIFLFAGQNIGEGYWYYFFFLLIVYHTEGSVFFYLYRDNIVSLSTRNTQEKAKLQYYRKLCWTLLSGIIIGMLINMVVLPLWLEKDITGYPKLMLALSIAAIPLLILEYFYTRERVSEDVALEHEATDIPVKTQLKALFSNKYYVILTILATVMMIVDNFKGGNVQFFYVKFLLNGAENPMMYTIYQVVTGIPGGIGAFIVYPLAKKYGIKNVTVVGYSMWLIGSVIGFLFPSQMIPVMVGGFIKNVGMLPNAYVAATLLCYAFDSIEAQSGLRLEGLMGVSVIFAIQQLICAPFAGGFESMLLKLGFVDVNGVIPSNEVIRFIVISFYVFDIVLAAIAVLILPRVDVEKHLPEITATLAERKKEALEAEPETSEAIS